MQSLECLIREACTHSKTTSWRFQKKVRGGGLVRQSIFDDPLMSIARVSTRTMEVACPPKTRGLSLRACAGCRAQSEACRDSTDADEHREPSQQQDDVDLSETDSDTVTGSAAEEPSQCEPSDLSESFGISQRTTAPAAFGSSSERGDSVALREREKLLAPRCER